MPISTFREFILPLDNVVRRIINDTNASLDFEVVKGHGNNLPVIQIGFQDATVAGHFAKSIHTQYKMGSKTYASKAKSVQAGANGTLQCVYFDKEEAIQLVKNVLSNTSNNGAEHFTLTVGDKYAGTVDSFVGGNYASSSSSSSSSSSRVGYRYAKPGASKFKDLPITRDEQAVLDLIKAHNAAVRVVDTNYSLDARNNVTLQNTNLDWNLRQLADPNNDNNRPSRYKLYKPRLQAKSTISKMNPATGSTYSYKVGLGRDRPGKGPDYVYTHTKKHPTTVLSPTPEHQTLFCNYGTVLLWDLNDCHHKGGRYQFISNATTASCKWLDGSNLGQRSTTLQTIRNHNLTGNSSRIIAHNECLWGYPAKKINAIGARYVKLSAYHQDALNDRINTLRVMYYSKDTVGINNDIPVVCLQTNQTHHLYTPANRIKDVNDALERSNTKAFALLKMNNFELLKKIISSSFFRLPANHDEIDRLIKNCGSLKIEVEEFAREEIAKSAFTDESQIMDIFEKYYSLGAVDELLQRGVELFSLPVAKKYLDKIIRKSAFTWDRSESNTQIFNWWLDNEEYGVAYAFFEKANGLIDIDQSKNYARIEKIHSTFLLNESERLKFSQLLYFGPGEITLNEQTFTALVADDKLVPALRVNFIKRIFNKNTGTVSRQIIFEQLTRKKDFALVSEFFVSHQLDKLEAKDIWQLLKPAIDFLLSCQDEAHIQAAFTDGPILDYVMAHEDDIETDNEIFLRYLKHTKLERTAPGMSQPTDPLIHLAILDQDKVLAKKLYHGDARTQRSGHAETPLQLAVKSFQYELAIDFIISSQEEAERLPEDQVERVLIHLVKTRPTLLYDAFVNVGEYGLFNWLCANQTPDFVARFYHLDAALKDGKDIFDICISYGAYGDKRYIKALKTMLLYLSDQKKNVTFAQLVFAGYVEEAKHIFPSIKEFTANEIVNDSGRTIFHYLATEDADLMEEIIKNSTQNIAKRDHALQSPIHLAALQPNLNACKILFPHVKQHLIGEELTELMKISLNKRDYAFATEILQLPFDRATCIDYQDSAGDTCMHRLLNDPQFAAEHVEMIRALLQHSTKSLTMENNYGRTPICTAIRSFRISDDFKKELLALIEPHHITPKVAGLVLIAICDRPTLYDVIREIFFVDVYAVDSQGNTALHTLVRKPNTSGLLPNTIALIKLLCEQGADPLLKNNAGVSALSSLLKQASGYLDRRYIEILKVLCKNLPNDYMADATAKQNARQLFSRSTIYNGENLLVDAVNDCDISFARWLCANDVNPFYKQRSRSLATRSAFEHAIAQTKQNSRFLPILITLLKTPVWHGSTPSDYAEVGVVLANQRVPLAEVDNIAANPKPKTAMLLRYSATHIQAMQDVASVIGFLEEMNRLHMDNVFRNPATGNLVADWQGNAITKAGKHILKIAKNRMLKLMDTHTINAVPLGIKKDVEDMLGISTGRMKKTTSISIYNLFARQRPKSHGKAHVLLDREIQKNNAWISRHTL